MKNGNMDNETGENGPSEILEIPLFLDGGNVTTSGRELRDKAPGYLRDLIMQGKLPGIQRIDDIKPGMITSHAGRASAVYIIRIPENPIVVRFSNSGIDAEEEALNRWREKGVPVPEVYSTEALAETISGKPVKYMVMEAIVDEDGMIARPADEFLLDNPDMAEAIGEKMSNMLLLLSKAQTSERVGGFLDSVRNDLAEPSIPDYLRLIISQRNNFLTEIGIDEITVQKLIAKIDEIKFPEIPSYCHGDFGAHSLLVNNKAELGLVVYDPRPQIGDPISDIARMRTRLQLRERRISGSGGNGSGDDLEKRKFERDTKVYNSMLASYELQTGEPIDQKRVTMHQISQEILSLQRHARMPSPSKDFELRKQLLIENINNII